MMALVQQYKKDKTLTFLLEQLILLMSILLIGQKSKYFVGSHPYRIQKQLDQDQKQKKIMQKQYREQLIIQMKQSQQKKRRQKELDLQMDRKYQKQFYQQLAQSQKKLDQNLSQQYLKNQRYQHSDRNIKSHKELGYNFPTIQKQRKFRIKNSRSETQPTSEFFGGKTRSRLKTESNDYHYNHSNIAIIESPEDRQKKLEQELRYKLDEVQELIDGSSKIWNNREQLQKISSKIAPIKLHLDKKYKVKYPDYNNYSTIINPEEEQERDYFKLPNISKNFHDFQHVNKQSEEQWQQWYSRQKMKELQVRYRQDLNILPSNIRLNRPKQNLS